VNPMEWYQEFPGAVTVCDRNGVILEMNDKAALTFDADGGRALIGRNMLDCHPEPARGTLVELLANPRVNAYTIEKRGVRKLIYQAPWFRTGSIGDSSSCRSRSRSRCRTSFAKDNAQG
jgi:PAS domain-containing protein